MINQAAGEDCEITDFDADWCDDSCSYTFTVATSVAAGRQHTCATLDMGAIRCWGLSTSGQLGHPGGFGDIGDNEPPSAFPPVDVGGHGIAVVAGGYHTCALLDTGTFRCWGLATSGQLGYGNIDGIGDPSAVGLVDVGDVATQLAAGHQHTCAVLPLGAIRCWGDNTFGQLGYGNQASIGDDELPSGVGPVDVGGTTTQIAAGQRHTCGLLDTGAARCWGSGASGKLGYGNTLNVGDTELPSSVGDIAVGGTVTQLAAGGAHTCALLQGGTVRCWGEGDDGRLGYGNTDDIGDDELPSSVGLVDLGGVATQIAAGEFHTCALLDGGDVRCWGVGSEGQLGYGDVASIGDDETPGSVGPVDVGGTATQLTADSRHNCVLLNTGAVRCWGYGDSGRLGYGDLESIGDDEAPSAAGDVPLL